MNSAATPLARVLVLVAVYAGFTVRLPGALTSTQDAIRQMPSVDRVMHEVTATDPRETTLQQIGAFWELQEIIDAFAYWNHRYKKYTAEESQLLNAYATAEYNVAQSFLRSLPTDAAKRKFSNDESSYRYSRSDRRFGIEGIPLFRLFFTPEFEAFFRRAVAEGDARALAARPGASAPAASNSANGSTELQSQLTRMANELGAVFGTNDKEDRSSSNSAASGRPEDDPNAGSAANKRGVEQYTAKNYEEAIEAFQAAIRVDPNKADYYKNLAAAQSALDQHEKAIASLKIALRLSANDDAAYNSLGNEYCAVDKPEDAVTAYQEALRRKPGNATYHFNLGDTYADLDETEDAVAQLREALRLNPEFPEAFKRLGEVYEALKQTASAIAAYQQAVRLEPTSALYHAKLAGAHFAAKDYETAVAHAKEALQLDPDEPDNYALLGQAQYSLQHYAEASSAFQQAAQRAPKTPSFLYGVACAQAKLGQWDAVAKTERQLETISPEWASKLQRELATSAPASDHNRSVPELLKKASEAYQTGLTLEKQKSAQANEAYASAVNYYSAAVAIDGNSFDALSGLGAAYYRQRSYGQAAQALGAAAKLKPDDAKVLNDYGLALLANGQALTALEVLQKAVALAPKTGFIVYNLGYTYYAIGQVEEALKAASALEAIDPASAKELRQLLPAVKDRPGSFPDPKIELVWLPAGNFLMGDDKGVDSTKPQHRVVLAHGFYLGKFEVTQKQWQIVMGDNPSFFKTSDALPVEQVSWTEAQEFIQRLNTLHNGYRYRLPSEAEWEFAARAGRTDYFWPDDDSSWSDHNSGMKTHPVGGKQPNKWGLYDLSGNVCEWCEDLYHADYQGAPADGSPWVDSPMRKFRVLRGGSFYMGFIAQTAESRQRETYSSTSRNNGLRVAADKTAE